VTDAGKKKRGPLRVRFKFADGSHEEMPLEKYEEHLLRRAAEAAAQEDPDSHALRALGERQLTETAQRLAKARASGLTGRANTSKANADRRARADREALQDFLAWCRKRPTLGSLTQSERLQKYIQLSRVPARRARRLRATLKARTIK